MVLDWSVHHWVPRRPTLGGWLDVSSGLQGLFDPQALPLMMLISFSLCLSQILSLQPYQGTGAMGRHRAHASAPGYRCIVRGVRPAFTVSCTPRQAIARCQEHNSDQRNALVVLAGSSMMEINVSEQSASPGCLCSRVRILCRRHNKVAMLLDAGHGVLAWR